MDNDFSEETIKLGLQPSPQEKRPRDRMFSVEDDPMHFREHRAADRAAFARLYRFTCGLSTKASKDDLLGDLARMKAWIERAERDIHDDIFASAHLSSISRHC